MRTDLSRKFRDPPQAGDTLVGHRLFGSGEQVPKEPGKIRQAVQPQGAAWRIVADDGIEYIVRATRYPKVWAVIGANR